MKYLNKFITAILIEMIFSVVIAFNAFAMGISISFSDVNASVGDEVNLIMTLSSTEGDIDSANIMLSYDDAMLEFVNGTNAQGDAGSIKVTSNTGSASNNQNFSLKFKAKTAGDATVVVSTWEVYDKDAKMATMQSQGSGRIKISEPSTDSTDAETTVEKTVVAVDKKDALLSSLQVSPGKLVPEFDTDIKNYDINVGSNISNIAVNAKPRQEGAKVIITGSDHLVVGVNAITVKVTAPDGSTVQSYIINVNKSSEKSDIDETTTAKTAEGNKEFQVSDIVSTATGMTIDGIDYQVSDSFDKNTLPEGFEETTFKYKEKEVKAGKMKDQDVYILYLVGNDGSGDFYIYNDISDKWSVYSQINTSQKSITVMPLDNGVEHPQGFKDSIIDINGKKVHGWVWSGDNDNRYCVVYAMNSDGRKDFYRYDMEEKTIQRYFVDPNADVGVTMDKYNSLQKKFNISKNIIYVLITALVILLFILLGRSMSYKDEKRKVATKQSKKGKKHGANISSKVNLISEDEMSDANPLEYMPLVQKKEEDNEDADNNSDGFAKVNLTSENKDEFNEADLLSDDNDKPDKADLSTDGEDNLKEEKSNDFEDLDI